MHTIISYYGDSIVMEGLMCIEEMDDLIKIVNGDSMKTIIFGFLGHKVTQLDGRNFLTYRDFKVVPDLCVNLFNLKKAIKK
jgi:hypothetical protein